MRLPEGLKGDETRALNAAPAPFHLRTPKDITNDVFYVCDLLLSNAMLIYYLSMFGLYSKDV